MIVKKRTDFEYSLRRMEMTVATFQEYLQYEHSLDKLLEIRSKKLIRKLKEKSVVSLLRGLKTASIRHIHYIYERGLRRFPNNFELWDDAINFLERKQSNALLDELLGKAIALHPKEIRFWIKAAEHELLHNNNIHAARVLMQRSLRINETKFDLWAAYFRLEVWNIHRALLRQQKLGISKEGTEEIIPGLIAPAMVVFRYAREAIVSNGSNVEDLEMLFAIHNETLTLSIDQLSTEVRQELLENTLPRVSNVDQQQEIILHLLSNHLLHYLQRRGNQLQSFEQVATELVGGILEQYESLSQCFSPDISHDNAIIFLSRWLLRVIQKVVLITAHLVQKDSSTDNGQVESEDSGADDHDDSESDDDDKSQGDDDEVDADNNNDEAKAQYQSRKEQKALEREERKKQKLSPLAKRLRLLIQSVYKQRHLLFQSCDLTSILTHRAAPLVRTLTASFAQSKDGKKWKKDTLASFVAILDRIVSFDLSADRYQQTMQGIAEMHWISCISLLGWHSEKSVEGKWKSLLVSQVGEEQVAGDNVLQHWQSRIDEFSTSHIVTQLTSQSSSSSSSASRQNGSSSFSAHSGPKLQLVQSLQTWAAEALCFLSLSNHLSLANDARTIESLRSKLPILSPWLIQPVPSTLVTGKSDTLEKNESISTFALVDPTLAASVTSTPGSELLLRLSQNDAVLYQNCIESIVADSKVVSATQREHWLLRFVQASVPSDEEWILLTDTEQIVSRWYQFTVAYEQLLEQHRRQPHLFARVDLARIFHKILQAMDTFLDNLHIDISTLFHPRKQSKITVVSDIDRTKMMQFVQGIVEKAASLCPQEESFAHRQIEILRALDKHAEANHLQFKRRRLA